MHIYARIISWSLCQRTDQGFLYNRVSVDDHNDMGACVTCMHVSHLSIWQQCVHADKERGMASCHPDTARLAGKCPTNSSRDFWQATDIPVVPWLQRCKRWEMRDSSQVRYGVVMLWSYICFFNYTPPKTSQINGWACPVLGDRVHLGSGVWRKDSTWIPGGEAADHFSSSNDGFCDQSVQVEHLEGWYQPVLGQCHRSWWALC